MREEETLTVLDLVTRLYLVGSHLCDVYLPRRNKNFPKVEIKRYTRKWGEGWGQKVKKETFSMKLSVLTLQLCLWVLVVSTRSGPGEPCCKEC